MIIMIYEPSDDSFLLQRNISKYAKKGMKVIDIGTGSGIQAEELRKHTVDVTAVDINPEVISHCKEKFDNIKIIESDLFSNVSGKFDLITFNPPYLPDDHRVKDIALDGGKHGYELTEMFLNDVVIHLNINGKLLLLFSSYTNKGKVDSFILQNCLKFKQIDMMKLDFEELFVYEISKSFLLKDLEKHGLKNVYYLTKGHRGIIFTGIDGGGRKIAVKSELSTSEAIGRIENEIMILKKINKYGIGPKILFHGEKYFAYEFIEGERIIDFIKANSKDKIIEVVLKVVDQLIILDKLGISKEEMHHPVKHILVGKEVVMIDFERAHHTQKPQNITQFCQFLIELTGVFKEKEIVVDKEGIIKFAKSYHGNVDVKPLLNMIKDW
jgi:release factor glutamine methyltransferase